jgi:hypothetical protein
MNVLLEDFREVLGSTTPITMEQAGLTFIQLADAGA